MSIGNTLETVPAGILERVGAVSPLAHRLLLVIGCALLFCLWLSRVPLVEVDETRYVTASRQMIETHDYIIPHYNGNERYEKPILIYWIQGASMRLLGKNEFAARLPSGLAGMLLVLIVYGFLLRWLTPRLPDPRQARGAAFLGAGALATLPLFTVWTRAATTDILLTLFITLTMLGLLQADLARRTTDEATGRREALRWYLLAAFCCGLAFLTKGPIAVLVPVLTWLIYHLRQGTLRAEARRVPWVPAILLFLVTAAPWYAATYVRDHGKFLKQFFLTENFARYAGGEQAAQAAVHISFFGKLEHRANGILGYLAVLLLFLFPYGAFLLDELRGEHRGTAFASDKSLGSIRRFAWIWIAVSVGFIALSKTQYPNYVQNIVAAVAILFALYLLELRRVGGLAVGLQLFFGAVWLALIEMVLLPHKSKFVLGLLGKFRPRPWSPPLPEQAAHALMIAVGVIGLALLMLVVIGALRRRAIGWAMAAWTAFLALLLIGVAPLAYVNAHGGSAEAGLAMRAYPADLYTVAYCPGKNLPENMVYYGHRKVTFIKRKDAENIGELKKTLEAHGTLLLATDAAGLEQAETLGRVTVLKRLQYFIIARVERPIK